MYITTKPKKERKLVIETPKFRNQELSEARNNRKAGRICEKRKHRSEQRRADIMDHL